MFHIHCVLWLVDLEQRLGSVAQASIGGEVGVLFRGGLQSFELESRGVGLTAGNCQILEKVSTKNPAAKSRSIIFGPRWFNRKPPAAPVPIEARTA